MNFNEALTKDMEGIIELHDYIMSFLIFIFFFTLVVLLFSYRSSSPKIMFYVKRYTYYGQVHDYKHAPILEFIGVLIPTFILVCIAFPSLLLLYHMDCPATPIFNIGVIGNQGFGTYEYNDFNPKLILMSIIQNSQLEEELQKIIVDILYIMRRFGGEVNGISEKQILHNPMWKCIPEKISLDSNMVLTKDPKFPRLLSTDQVLVIPSGIPIRFLVTSNDVIHSGAVPNFGIKIDAVPGRLNQVIVETFLLGTTGGQCSELCGVNHAFMPIEIRSLSKSDFLYFVNIKAKEVLSDFYIQYFSTRFNIIQTFLQYILEHRGGMNKLDDINEFYYRIKYINLILKFIKDRNV